MTHSQVEIALEFLLEIGGDQCFSEYEVFSKKLVETNIAIWAENCRSPTSFWALCQYEFPNLSKFAQQLLIIPAGTALLEGFFSNWTFVANSYRNRLKDENSEALADNYYSLKSLDVEELCK